MELEKLMKELSGNVGGLIETLAAQGKTLADLGVSLEGQDTRLVTIENRLEDLDKRTKSRKWADMPGLEDGEDGQQFSLFKAVTAIVTGDWSQAEFEKEVFRQTRTMAAGDDTMGGYLVPAQAIPELIELLRAEAVCMKLGATLLPNLQGSPVEIPKQTGGATAYWVGENSEITASDLATGQLQLTPKACAAMVKVSNRLMRMSNPSAEAMIRNDIGLSVALAVDLAALRGTGADNQPTGIANTSGINTLAGGSAAPTFDSFYDMEYELAVDNALRGKLGVAFHPAVKKRLSKVKVPQYSGDTGGAYVLAPPSVKELDAWIGYPWQMTTQIPITLGGGGNETELYFANWMELIIAQWAGMEILASQETSDAFARNQTWIRVITEVDVGLRHPESFCLGSAFLA